MALKIGELFATLEIDDKDFSKGLQSAQNQTKVLSSAIAASEKTISRYQSELSKAQSSLRSAEQAQAQLNQRLETARSAQSSLQSEVSRLTDAYKAQAAMTGENSDAANELGLRLIEARQALEQSGEEVQKLTQQSQKGEQQLRKLGKSVDEISGNLDSAEQSLSGFQSQLSAANSVLSSSAARLNAAGQAMQEYGKSVQSATEWQNKLGNLLTVGVTTPVVGAFTYAAKEVISFEDAFAGVEKTVDGTDEQLAALESSLVEMSHNLPVTAEGLAAIAESAGQLGIELDVIDEFTETMAKLESATNLGEEGATILARFANITGMDKTGENFERLGSAIVELGNTSATTESEIANMAMRLAGAGAQVGMTESEILGISAALSSLGLQAEAGGSAISRVLTDMQLAVETGSDSLEQFASVAGMTADEFATTFREDAAGALAEFIAGLGSGTASATQLLDEMGITEVVITDTLKRASNATDLFSASIESASRAWDENIALTNEAAKRNQTMASRITMVKNRVDTAARSLGNTLMPVVEDVVEAIGEAADWFASLDEATVRNVATWGALAAAIGPALKLLKTANDTVGSAVKTLGKLAEGVSSAGSLGGALSALAGNVGKLLGPAGIAAVAAAAGYAAYKFVDWASGAAAAREAMERLNEVAQEWAETNATTSFEQSEGLQEFGLSKEVFSPKAGTAWFEELKRVWTDGEIETDEIVSEMTEGFTSGTDAMRASLEQIRATAESGGYAGEGFLTGLDADMERLNEIDAQVASLLEKRQNGYFSEDDLAQLQALIDERGEISIKYNLTPVDGVDGFSQITQGVQSALSRGADAGTVWSDAYAAASQGIQSYTDALNAEYDSQYAIIQMMEAGSEEQRVALEQLQTWYNEQAAAGTQAYAQALAEAAEATGAFEEGGQYAGTIDQLAAALDAMNAASANPNSENIEALSEALSGLDETQVTEMAAALSAMQASGVEMSDGMEQAVDAISALKGAVEEGTFDNIESLSTALDSMFGEGFDEEVLEINASLNTTMLDETYNAWAAGEHAEIIPLLDTTNMTLDLSNEDVTLTVTSVETGDQTSYRIEGIDQLTGTVVAVNDAGEQTVFTLEQLQQMNGTVTAVSYSGTAETLSASLGLNELVGQITEIITPPEPVSVPARMDFSDGEYSNSRYAVGSYNNSKSALNQQSWTAMADSGRQALDAVNAFAEAKRQYDAALASGSPDAEGWQLQMRLNADTLTYLAQSGEGFDTVASYVANGLELLSEGSLTPEDALGLAEFVTSLQTSISEMEGTEFDGVATAMKESLATAFSSENIGWDSTTESILGDLTAAIESSTDSFAELGISIVQGVGSGMTQDMSSIDTASGNIATYTYTSLASAVQQGSPAGLTKPIGLSVTQGVGAGMTEDMSSLDLAATTLALHLQSAIGAALGTGEGPAASMASISAGIPAGIGQGLAQYSFATDAALLAANLQGALSSAFAGTASMNAIGMGQSAGLALGLTSYSFAPATSTMASAITSSMAGYSNSLWASGYNLSFGMAQGILSGQSTVINAAVRVAQAAIRAANNTLEVHSPSRVLMETGQNAGQGLAIGMMNEINAVERASQSVASALIEGSTVRNPALRAAAPYHESRQRREAISIDYDRLAQAMARLNIRLDYDGRTVGRIGAEDTARGQAEYRRSTALGFGY